MSKLSLIIQISIRLIPQICKGMPNNIRIRIEQNIILFIYPEPLKFQFEIPMEQKTHNGNQ